MDKELIKAFLKDIIIKEGLTPDQSSKVMSKYDSIYKGMLKGDKKKLMKYTDPKFNRPNPDAMAMGRAINLVKKDSLDEIEKDRFAGEDPRAGSTIKGRGFDWEKNNSQEIVIYNGEEHEVMRRVDDELGKRIYIRPKEESAILGKKNLFWVKPEDLEESVNEAGFQKMSQSQFKLRTAIKDQEKQNRLAKDDSEFPAGDLHKILISKVLGRGELDPKYDKTYKALLKKFDLVESLNEARTDLEREYSQYDSFTLNNRHYTIKDIEEYPGNRVQIITQPGSEIDPVTGDYEKSKIFFSDKILKMGGEFHKKERKKRTAPAWNKGQTSTTRRQYEKILKGAMRDAAGMGDEEFTYDMATSMIYDPEISSYLDREYPGLGKNGKIQQLQYDLEMYLQESVNEKKLTKAEKDKKEDIIMSMKKKKGGKKKLTDKDYAIATSTAKKVAESRLTELIKDALKNPKGAAIEKTMLKEYTDDNFSGEELINQVNSEKPDELQADFIEEFFPNGFRSQQQAIEALRASDQSPIKQRMGQYAPMFVHVQFHEFTDQADNKYGVHQTQYYNSNFKDKPGGEKFNPGVTQLYIYNRKTDQDIGTILVKTDEYVKDLELLRSRGQLGQRVSEASKGDEELEKLKKEAEKYNPKDIRYKEIQKKIYDLEYEKSYGLPGSKAAKKFDKSKLTEHILKKLRGNVNEGKLSFDLDGLYLATDIKKLRKFHDILKSVGTDWVKGGYDSEKIKEYLNIWIDENLKNLNESVLAKRILKKLRGQ